MCHVTTLHLDSNLNAMRIYEDYNIISNNPKRHRQGNACNNDINSSCVLTTLSDSGGINCLWHICNLRVIDLLKKRPSWVWTKKTYVKEEDCVLLTTQIDLALQWCKLYHWNFHFRNFQQKVVNKKWIKRTYRVIKRDLIVNGFHAVVLVWLVLI